MRTFVSFFNLTRHGGVDDVKAHCWQLRFKGYGWGQVSIEMSEMGNDGNHVD